MKHRLICGTLAFLMLIGQGTGNLFPVMSSVRAAETDTQPGQTEEQPEEIITEQTTAAPQETTTVQTTTATERLTTTGTVTTATQAVTSTTAFLTTTALTTTTVTTTAETQPPAQAERPESLKKIAQDNLVGEWSNFNNGLEHYEIRMTPKKQKIYFGQQWGTDFNTDKDFEAPDCHGYYYYSAEYSQKDVELPQTAKKWLENGQFQLRACIDGNGSLADRDISKFTYVPDNELSCWYMFKIKGYSEDYYHAAYYKEGNWIIRVVFETENDAEQLFVNRYVMDAAPEYSPNTWNDKWTVNKQHHRLGVNWNDIVYGNHWEKLEVTPQNGKLNCYLRNMDSNDKEHSGGVCKWSAPVGTPAITDVRLYFMERTTQVVTEAPDEEDSEETQTTATTAAYYFREINRNDVGNGEPVQGDLNDFDDAGYLSADKGKANMEKTVVLLVKAEDKSCNNMNYYKGDSQYAAGSLDKFTEFLPKQHNSGNNQQKTLEKKELEVAFTETIGTSTDGWFIVELSDGEYKNLSIQTIYNNVYSGLLPLNDEVSMYRDMRTSNLIIDSKAPSINGIPAGTYYSKNDHAFTISVSDHAFDRAEVTETYREKESEDAEAVETPPYFISGNNGKFKIELDDRDEGCYTFTFSVKDRAGNKAEKKTGSYGLDRTAPKGDAKLYYNNTAVKYTENLCNIEEKDAGGKVLLRRYWFRYGEMQKTEDAPAYDDCFGLSLDPIDINMERIELKYNITYNNKTNNDTGETILDYDRNKGQWKIRGTNTCLNKEGEELKKVNPSLKVLFSLKTLSDIKQITVTATYCDHTESTDMPVIELNFDNDGPVIRTDGNQVIKIEHSFSDRVLHILTFGLYSNQSITLTAGAMDDGCGVIEPGGIRMFLYEREGEKLTALNEEPLKFEKGDGNLWSITLDAGMIAGIIRIETYDKLGNSRKYSLYAPEDGNGNPIDNGTLIAAECSSETTAKDFGLEIERNEPAFAAPKLLQDADDDKGTAWEEDSWYQAHTAEENGGAKLEGSEYVELSVSDKDSGLYAVHIHLAETDEKGNVKMEDTPDGRTQIRYAHPIDLQTCANTKVKQDAETGWKHFRESWNAQKLTALSDVPHTLCYRISMQDIVDMRPEALNENGYYVVVAEAEDLCGNIADWKKFSFYVDSHNPAVEEITFSPADADGHTPEIDDPVETFKIGDQFGFYFNEETVVSVAYSDAAASSGVKKVEYYLQKCEGAETTEEAEPQWNTADKLTPDPDDSDNIHEDSNIAAFDDSGIATFTVPEKFRGMVYTKVTDNVGNTSGAIMPKDAFVVDDAETHAGIEHIIFSELGDPQHRDNAGNKLFSDAVKVSVTVTDTMSGIRSLKVHRSSEQGGEQDEVLTLENFNEEYQVGAEISGWQITAMDHNLITEMKKTYIYDTDDNDISISAEMTDRANNTLPPKQLETFSIDLTNPVIQVTFDNNNGRSRQEGMFYNTQRTATIRVTDRNFGTLTNNGATIGFQQETGEGYVYTAQVSYHTNGKHIIQIAAVDLAGRAAAPFSQEFYIDLDNMTVTTNIKEFINADTKNNFKSAKKMTFEFEDDNFDPDLVHCNVNVKNPAEGQAIPDPFYLSDWQGTTLVLTFEEDLQYLVHLTAEDKAGNQHLVWIDKATGNIVNGDKNSKAANSIDSEQFEIDTIAPVLKEPENKKAFFYGKSRKTGAEGIDYSITPFITYEDLNSRDIQTEVLRYYITEKDGMKSVISDPAQKELVEGDSYQMQWQNGETIPDGVYEIKTTASDLAGNSTTSVHTFFVQTVAEHTVYAPREYLDLFDGIGKNYDKFGEMEVPITAILQKGEDIEITVAGEVVPDTYIETVDHPVSRSSKLRPEEEDLGENAIRRTVILHLAYIQDRYNEEDIMVDYALAVNIRCGEENETVKLATVSIDNVAPTGDYKADLKEIKNVYDAKTLEIIIEGVADDIDLDSCEFIDTVGSQTKRIPTSNITLKDHTISFVLGEGQHTVSILLRDFAGNEYPLQTYEVYIGTFIGKWGTFIFGGIGGILLLIGAAVAGRLIKKRREATSLA